MKTFSILVALSAASSMLLFVSVDAKPQFVARIPNGGNVQGVQALGHVDTAGGGAQNAFGEGFEVAGEKWTVAFCQADSDGDGQTNGEELGDPCCTWTVGATPAYSTGVSHPGDATSKADATLWATAACASGSTTTTTPAPSKAAASTTTTPAPSATTTSGAAAAVAGAAVAGVVTCVAVLAQL